MKNSALRKVFNPGAVFRTVAERIIRGPKRVTMRMPKGRPPPPKRPVPHAPKKPKLAATGTKLDRLCAICLGKLEPGVSMTFCECGKFFHIDCITRVHECPLCNRTMELRDVVIGESVGKGLQVSTDEEGDVTEFVYQCPVCERYVAADAGTCECGAVFEGEGDEDVTFHCPSCGAEVGGDAVRCESCGLSFDEGG
jgi:hypothetical protein